MTNTVKTVMLAMAASSAILILLVPLICTIIILRSYSSSGKYYYDENSKFVVKEGHTTLDCGPSAQDFSTEAGESISRKGTNASYDAVFYVLTAFYFVFVTLLIVLKTRVLWRNIDLRQNNLEGLSRTVDVISFSILMPLMFFPVIFITYDTCLATDVPEWAFSARFAQIILIFIGIYLAAALLTVCFKNTSFRKPLLVLTIISYSLVMVLAFIFHVLAFFGSSQSKIISGCVLGDIGLQLAGLFLTSLVSVR